MSQSTTRRALLARTVAAAAAVPLTAGAASAFPQAHPDAELLKLGAEYDRLIALEEDAIARSEENWAAWDAARESICRDHIGQSVPIEVFNLAADRIDREHPIAFPTVEHVHEIMDKPARRIMALPAHTAEGLAVKARFVRYACDHYWETSFDDADWDHKAVRSLVDSVLSLGENTQ